MHDRSVQTLALGTADMREANQKTAVLTGGAHSGTCSFDAQLREVPTGTHHQTYSDSCVRSCVWINLQLPDR